VSTSREFTTASCGRNYFLFIIRPLARPFYYWSPSNLPKHNIAMTLDFRSGVINPIDCATDAWDIIKPDYWLLFAISLVGMLIGGLTLYILLGAMMCGMFYVFIRKIDGYPAALDDLWKGMEFVLPGLVVTLIIVVPMVIVYAIIYVPFIVALAIGPSLGEGELMAMLFTAAAVDLALIILMVCFHTLLLFSFPLIADRRLGAMAAITTSARAVLKNLSGVAGVILINMVLTFLGMLACGFGVYLVLPLMLATNVVAYRKVFPRQHGPQFEPPPPYVFQGL